MTRNKEKDGAFPDIPDEEEGGTRFLFFPEDPNKDKVEEKPEKDKKKDPKAKDDGEAEG